MNFCQKCYRLLLSAAIFKKSHSWCSFQGELVRNVLSNDSLTLKTSMYQLSTYKLIILVLLKVKLQSYFLRTELLLDKFEEILRHNNQMIQCCILYYFTSEDSMKRKCLNTTETILPLYVEIRQLH